MLNQTPHPSTPHYISLTTEQAASTSVSSMPASARAALAAHTAAANSPPSACNHSTVTRWHSNRPAAGQGQKRGHLLFCTTRHLLCDLCIHRHTHHNHHTNTPFVTSDGNNNSVRSSSWTTTTKKHQQHTCSTSTLTSTEAFGNLSTSTTASSVDCSSDDMALRFTL